MNHTETNTDAGADVGRREAAAHEALGAQTSAVSSAAGLGKVNGAPDTPVPVADHPINRIGELLLRCIGTLRHDADDTEKAGPRGLSRDRSTRAADFLGHWRPKGEET